MEAAEEAIKLMSTNIADMHIRIYITNNAWMC